MSLNKIDKRLNFMNYNFTAIVVPLAFYFGAAHSTEVRAQSSESRFIEKIPIKLCCVASEMGNVLLVYSPDILDVVRVGLCSLAKPAPKESTEVIAFGTRLTATSKPMSNDSSHNTAETNGGQVGKNQRQVFTHVSLFIGLMILCACAGACLVFQWKTWDLARRTLRKLEESKL